MGAAMALDSATIPAPPVPGTSSADSNTISRAIRTIAALVAGLTCGAAAAAPATSGVSERHALLTLIIPALYPLIEALADRIRGHAQRRKNAKGVREKPPQH
jgi:hypothetical protein